MVPGIAEQIPISLLSQGRTRIGGPGTTTWEQPRGTNTWWKGSVVTVWFVYSESDYIGQGQDRALRNRIAKCNTGSNLSNKRTFWEDTVLRFLKKHNERQRKWKDPLIEIPAFFLWCCDRPTRSRGHILGSYYHLTPEEGRGVYKHKLLERLKFLFMRDQTLFQQYSIFIFRQEPLLWMSERRTVIL